MANGRMEPLPPRVPPLTTTEPEPVAAPEALFALSVPALMVVVSA